MFKTILHSVDSLVSGRDRERILSVFAERAVARIHRISAGLVNFHTSAIGDHVIIRMIDFRGNRGDRWLLLLESLLGIRIGNLTPGDFLV